MIYVAKLLKNGFYFLGCQPFRPFTFGGWLLFAGVSSLSRYFRGAMLYKIVTTQLFNEIKKNSSKARDTILKSGYITWDVYWPVVKVNNNQSEVAVGVKTLSAFLIQFQGTYFAHFILMHDAVNINQSKVVNNTVIILRPKKIEFV